MVHGFFSLVANLLLVVLRLYWRTYGRVGVRQITERVHSTCCFSVVSLLTLSVPRDESVVPRNESISFPVHTPYILGSRIVESAPPHRFYCCCPIILYILFILLLLMMTSSRHLRRKSKTCEYEENTKQTRRSNIWPEPNLDSSRPNDITCTIRPP